MSEYIYDLGPFSRPVTTGSETAQRWFDRGLNWTWGYNHDEAVACFQKALQHDPGCAMAHWGVAYASGPNYNLPWNKMDPKGRAKALARAYEATQAAKATAATATPVEQALIAALDARYPQPEPIEDMAPWNDAFTDAMRPVLARFPEDMEVICIFAEAIMNRTPWKMWDLKSGGVAKGAMTHEAIEVFEAAFARLPGAWDHPGLLHLYVHLMEMSPHPERALRQGDRLRTISPDAGHLIHMPTHIDVLCGQYRDVVSTNQAAIVADRKFLAHRGPLNLYSGYRIHNYHFAIYGAMFLGQYSAAIDAAEELIATVPEDLLRMTSPPMGDFVEAYLSMKQHVLIRFGRWDDIIAQDLPPDPELYCSTTAMMLYAKGVAFSATGRIAEAEAARAQFLAAKDRVPKTRRIHNNILPDLLDVAAAMLEGELEYRKGNHDAAFAHLRYSVDLDDDLPYDEPWGWMQPSRHALGALLLEQNRAEEAEAVYRADLGLDPTLSRACQHPGNVWSLSGLHTCLVRRGNRAEAAIIRQQLDIAAARSEVPVDVSCFCAGRGN